MEKATGSWADVDPAVLDAELDEHLIKLPSGRYGWRISVPAMMSYWSELARPTVLPPEGTPTTLVRAAFDVAALCQRPTHRGAAANAWEPTSSCWTFDCNHMVPGAKPTEAAALIRTQFQVC